MFVGHYAAAFGARKLVGQVPLWFLFFAVQFADYLWAVFILLGIEGARVVPNFLPASHLDLYFIPYSHSVVATVFWSTLLALIYVVVARPSRRWAAAAIVAFAVTSHWVLDLVVHTQDLPLFYGDPKFGFGLWRYQVFSQLIEVGLLFLGLMIYMRATTPKGVLGQLTLVLLMVAMLVMQAIGQVPPAEDQSIEAFARTALLAYSGLVALAFLVDCTRRVR
ncbi:MAG: hypothetical protein AAF225_14225 [Pseudomonadota bacterium]